MGRLAGSGVAYFHYLDDILLLGRDRALLRVVTRGRCEFLQAQSLLISTKSQTEPSALVTWIGKTFDLARGTVRNTPGTVRKEPAVVVRAAVSNMTPKRVERVAGRLQWLFGPRRGMTAFMFGWYRWKSAGFRFARRLSRMMTLSMVDAFLIGTVPVHGTLSDPPPPCLHLGWH